MPIKAMLCRAVEDLNDRGRGAKELLKWYKFMIGRKAACVETRSAAGTSAPKEVQY